MPAFDHPRTLIDWGNPAAGATAAVTATGAGRWLFLVRGVIEWEGAVGSTPPVVTLAAWKTFAVSGAPAGAQSVVGRPPNP